MRPIEVSLTISPHQTGDVVITKWRSVSGMFSKSAEIEMPPLGGLLVAANREDKMLDRPAAIAA